MRSARHQTDHPSMMIHYNKIISHSFCFFLCSMMIYDTSNICCHAFILPDCRYQGSLSSFLPRNLDNRNITVEEAETVNELHLYRETLESSPIRLKGLNSFHDFRKSMGRTYSSHRKPFSFLIICMECFALPFSFINIIL